MINSQITAKSDGFIMNVANQITTSYDSKKFNEVNGTLNDSENNSGLNYLTYLKNNQSNVLYNPIDEIQQQWADASRGLTAAGTAVVVVAAVTATVLTAGAAAPATATAAAAGTVSVSTTTFVVSTAVVSSAMATASVSAVNMSMNVDGDIFKQAKDVSNQTLKDTTSNESLKNMAIAGLTAAATMGISYGISSMSEAANGANAANAANGVNTVNSSGQVANASQFPTALDSVSTSLSYNPSAFNLGSSTSFASNATSATSTVTMTDRFLNAVQNSVVQTVSSSAAQSAVNGDSFTDSLKNSTKNLLINAVGELAANEIGTNYKAGEISKAQQLTLHAILGCGMAAAGGNNCAAGAASGVVGESIAEILSNNTTLSRQQIIESSKLAGALTSASIAGSDDGDSVFAGSQVARNAAENNFLHPGTAAGAVVGAGGAVAVSYMDGERDWRKLAVSGAVGGATGAVGGTLLNPQIVMQGVVIGGSVGVGVCAAEGYFSTKLTNPNATSEQIFNNAARSAIVGGVSGAVTGGFGGAMATTGIAGFASESIAASNGLIAGLFANAFTQNAFNSTTLSSATPTLKQLQLLDPTYQPQPHIIPQTPVIIPNSVLFPNKN